MKYVIIHLNNTNITNIKILLHNEVNNNLFIAINDALKTLWNSSKPIVMQTYLRCPEVCCILLRINSIIQCCAVLIEALA